MNIELQGCGLVILAVLMILFLTEKSLDLTSRRLFFKTIISSSICLVLDIASIFGIYGALYQGLNPLVAQLLCKAYVISLLLQGYEGFLYAAGEFFDESHTLLGNAFRAWFVLGCAGVAALPISYYLHGRVVYSYGPAVYFAYGIVVVFIASSIYMAYRGTQRTSRRRRRTILIWQLGWLAAAIIQFLKPELLVAGFAVAAGEVLTYAELENPHEGIDRITGQFSANALFTYLDDLYRHRTPFSAIQIRVEYRVPVVDPTTEQAVMVRIANFLNKDRNTYVFRQADDELTVTYRSAEHLWSSYHTIVARAEQAADLPVKLWYTIVPDGSLLHSADEFTRCCSYVERNSPGVDAFVVDKSVVRDMHRYFQTQQLISAALDDGRVEVFFQPIYNIKRQRFTTAEALVRIRDVDKSLVPPGFFIPVAEENGLIVPLGIEIFRQVCAFLSSGRAQALGLEYVEVNLSVVQFDEDNPAGFVEDMLERYHVDPAQINLEITETASINAKRVLLKNMNRLIERGVRFSLDDFGTGRSNLDYFVNMPVSIIKFDHSFTQGYFKNQKARYVVESVVGLMQKMGLPIVAEGVETKEQLDAMHDLGVAFIQGFYFSKPIPADEFLTFLKQHNGASA